MFSSKKHFLINPTYKHALIELKMFECFWTTKIIASYLITPGIKVSHLSVAFNF